MVDEAQEPGEGAPAPEEPREPATPFTWVIVAAVAVWLIGAAMIFVSLG
jgi:hypothetical protein